ncbi:hypothetical protein GCM10027514_39790 [Azotobacter armeniacus]
MARKSPRASDPYWPAPDELGNGREWVAVHCNIQQCDGQEQLRNQQLGHAHPCPLLLHGARLDQDVEWPYVKDAKQAEPEDATQHPPGLPTGQHAPPIMGNGGLGEAAGTPPEQQTEKAQADGAEGHQTDFSPAPGELLAEHRA